MSKKYVKPLGNRIIGKRVKDNGELKTTPSGILLVQNSSEEDKYSKIEVLKVGPGYWSVNGAFIKTEVSVGDIVYIIKLAGYVIPKGKDDTILEDNEELVLFQDSDVMFSQEIVE
jgi:co-chaperonin GroES (HSP10)